MTTEKILLEFNKVSKSFGSVQANNQVSFAVKQGSIHALIGENGAGKSTIMKILFGLYQADHGEIRLRGQKLNILSPIDAKKHRIGMVHQHFMLAGPISAMNHFFLDEKPTSLKGFFTPLPAEKKLQQLQALSERYQMAVPWQEPVEKLSVGIQQRLEILKILYNEADILILDEPTAVLAPQEILALFSQLRELKAQGKTILFITHKLKEVMSLADTVTVFRKGEVIAQKNIEDTNPRDLSELMVGRKLIELVRSPAMPGERLLEIKNLSFKTQGRERLKNLDFHIHSGEILGIAGIEGNGQSDLIQILVQPKAHEKAVSGELRWKTNSILSKSAKDLKEMGFSFFPEDRLTQGALVQSNLKENFLLGQHRSPDFQKMGIFKPHEISRVTTEEMKKLDVWPRNPNAIFKNLSGGNQQKLVVARELYRKPPFLLAAQPTRGVDIGAIEKIHFEMDLLRKNGAAILLISSELDELMKLSDRIMVIRHGSLLGQILHPPFDETQIGCMMLGAV